MRVGDIVTVAYPNHASFTSLNGGNGGVRVRVPQSNAIYTISEVIDMKKANLIYTRQWGHVRVRLKEIENPPGYYGYGNVPALFPAEAFTIVLSCVTTEDDIIEELEQLNADK